MKLDKLSQAILNAVNARDNARIAEQGAAGEAMNAVQLILTSKTKRAAYIQEHVIAYKMGNSPFDSAKGKAEFYSHVIDGIPSLVKERDAVKHAQDVRAKFKKEPDSVDATDHDAANRVMASNPESIYSVYKSHQVTVSQIVSAVASVLQEASNVKAGEQPKPISFNDGSVDIGGEKRSYSKLRTFKKPTPAPSAVSGKASDAGADPKRFDTIKSLDEAASIAAILSNYIGDVDGEILRSHARFVKELSILFNVAGEKLTKPSTATVDESKPRGGGKVTKRTRSKAATAKAA